LAGTVILLFSALLLYRLAEAATDHPDGVVRDVLFPVVAEKTLHELVAEHKAGGRTYAVQVQIRLHASYGTHYRRLLPALLDVLEFRSTTPRTARSSWLSICSSAMS
jgi:hypothetical protein